MTTKSTVVVPPEEALTGNGGRRCDFSKEGVQVAGVVPVRRENLRPGASQMTDRGGHQVGSDGSGGGGGSPKAAFATSPISAVPNSAGSPLSASKASMSPI